MADERERWQERIMKLYMSEPIAFHKAVALIPAHDEVISLRETVQGIETLCSPADVARIVIALSPYATNACRREADLLACDCVPIPVTAIQERKGAMAKELQQVLRAQSDASHCLLWTADQDAPPETAALMIEKAKKNPAAVVRLSRFLPGGGLPASKKGFVNLRDTVFARLVCLLYRSKQTDPHFGLAMFPIHDFLRFDLREKFMAFTLEYNLCFERIGTQFIELPLKQQPRPEGRSNLSVMNKLRYFVPVIRLRFLPRRKIFKEGPHEQT